MDQQKTRKECLMDVVNNHPVLGVVAFCGTLLLAFVGFIQSVAYLTKLPSKLHKPKLQVVFLAGTEVSEQQVVNPTWKDSHWTGYSEPISLQLAIKNSGKATATNLHIYVRCFGSTILINNSSGRAAPPAVLTDIEDIHSEDSVTTYSIDRLEKKSLPIPFENKLQLRFRFNAVIGVPIVEAGLPSIQRGFISFGDIRRAGGFGDFPIHYTITCAETEQPTKGTLHVSLGKLIRKQIQRFQEEAVMGHAHEHVGEVPLDDIVTKADIRITKVRNIGLNMIGPYRKPVSALLKELETPSSFLLYMETTEGDIYIEQDSDKDGYVDAIYLSNLEKENTLFHLKPAIQMKNMPLEFVLDREKNAISSITDDRIIKGK